MKLSTCTRHPSAGRFMRTCSGCAQDTHDAQYGNPAAAARKVRKVLGGSGVATLVRPDAGETPARRLVWSLHELGDLWDRHPGARVTARVVDGATEVSLWIDLTGIGTVEVFTQVGSLDEYPLGVPDIWYFAESTAATV